MSDERVWQLEQNWRVQFGLFLNRAGLMLLVVATVTMAGWGVMGILSHHSLDTLSTVLVYQAVGERLGGLVYLGFAILAGWGIAHPGRNGFIAGLFQNALLTTAAGRVVFAVVQAKYAGGTAAIAAPGDFILTDQLLVLTAAFGHLVSLFIYHGQQERLNRLSNGGR